MAGRFSALIYVAVNLVQVRSLEAPETTTLQTLVFEIPTTLGFSMIKYPLLGMGFTVVIFIVYSDEAEISVED